MANISKIAFEKYVTSNTPCSIFHPWEGNCLEALKITAKYCLIGSGKVMLPIYIIKLILGLKKISVSRFIRLVLAYCRSTAYLSLTYLLILHIPCLISSYSFSYYACASVAVLILSLTMSMESRSNRNGNSFFVVNQVLLILINNLTSNDISRRTILMKTSAFMVVSSLLMYLFKTRKSSSKITHMWFYPEESIYLENNNELNSQKCVHDGTCQNYTFKGLCKYFAMGYAMEIISSSTLKLFHLFRNPRLMIKLLFHADNVKMGLFFGSYVALYRLLSCRLKKKNGKYLPKHTFISALFSGITYYLKPNIYFLTIGIATSLQLLWERIPSIPNTPEYINYPNVMFVVCCAIVVDSYLFKYDNTPRISKKMIESITNGLQSEKCPNDNITSSSRGSEVINLMF